MEGVAVLLTKQPALSPFGLRSACRSSGALPRNPARRGRFCSGHSCAESGKGGSAPLCTLAPGGGPFRSPPPSPLQLAGSSFATPPLIPLAASPAGTSGVLRPVWTLPGQGCSPLALHPLASSDGARGKLAASPCTPWPGRHRASSARPRPSARCAPKSRWSGADRPLPRPLVMRAGCTGPVSKKRTMHV